MKKIWPFSFYFLFYAGMSSFIPFLVLFYQELKFTGPQIGLLTGIPPLISLFAGPYLANLADATRRHRLIMSMGIAIAIAAALLMQAMHVFLIIFPIVLIFNFFIAPVVSLADSSTMSMLGEDRSMYGRIRLGGSIGWGVFATISGVLVDNYGLKIAFWTFSLLMFANLFVVQRIAHDSTEHPRSKNQGIRYFLTNRRWLIFLLSSFFGGLGAMTVASYLFPYMAEMGSSESLMGIASFIATVAELPIFFFGNRLLKRFSSYRLFILALVLIGIRSLLLAWASEPFTVIIVQALGGVVFPAMWLAGVAYADQLAPTGLKSTAQGLLGAMMFGFSSAVGGFVGGLLLESIGGRGLFLVFGIVILVGLGLIEGFKRLVPEKVISQPATLD